MSIEQAGLLETVWLKVVPHLVAKVAPVETDYLGKILGCIRKKCTFAYQKVSFVDVECMFSATESAFNVSECPFSDVE